MGTGIPEALVNLKVRVMGADKDRPDAVPLSGSAMAEIADGSKAST